jgi:hypothetical protein
MDDDSKRINKYLITQNVPYEGKNTWTVFASTVEEAEEFVLKSNKNLSIYELSFDVLKYNIKGTKFKGIHKYNFY